MASIQPILMIGEITTSRIIKVKKVKSRSRPKLKMSIKMEKIKMKYKKIQVTIKITLIKMVVPVWKNILAKFLVLLKWKELHALRANAVVINLQKCNLILWKQVAITFSGCVTVLSIKEKTLNDNSLYDSRNYVCMLLI